MSLSTNSYPWQELYWHATGETDDTLRLTRITDAMAAIEQRLLSPIADGGREHQEIENAKRGLAILRAERDLRD
jgi:hypothetical protein